MKLFIPLLLLTIFCSAQEQSEIVKDKGSLYFGLMKSYIPLKQFNTALQEYSEKREWLETIPDLSNNIIGVIIGNGFFDSNKAYYDLNLFISGKETTSSGYSNYGYSSRVFRINNWGLGFDYLITNERLFNQIYIGGSLRYSHLSFSSSSTFEDQWRLSKSYVSLSPKIQFIPSFFKRMVFLDFQFNMPCNQISIKGLKKDLGTIKTNSYLWPCSFDMSLKVSLL